MSEEEMKEKERKQERTIKATRYTLIAMFTFLGGSAIWALFEWGKPRIDEEGNVKEDDYSKYFIPKQYLLRTINTFKDYSEVLREPSRELLLPPPLEHPYVQPPYTLVVELNGVLLNPEWTYKTGWRFKKRPFLDYFIQQCGPPLFELVVFTSESGWMAFPLVDNLDPNGYIMHRLFRDSTRYMNGVRVKDLNCLNRDLKKVIHIDWNKDVCQLNPNNCFILKKYEGENQDKTLFDLCQLLRTIATQGVDDVREIISHYSKYDDPIEAFKENQRLMIEQEEERKKMKLAQNKSFVSSFKRK